MKKSEVVITGEPQKDRVRQLLDRVPTDGKWLVIIKPITALRSDRQHRLHRLWCGIAAQELGYYPQDLHTVWKREHYLPLYLMREDVELRHQKLHTAIQAAIAANDVESVRAYSELITTKDAKLKEMTAALGHIDHHCADLGIILPRPEHRGLIPP